MLSKLNTFLSSSNGIIYLLHYYSHIKHEIPLNTALHAKYVISYTWVRQVPAAHERLSELRYNSNPICNSYSDNPEALAQQYKTIILVHIPR